MKYFVMLGDGMADRPIPELSGKTPLEAAHKPTMDYIAKNGELGLTNTLFEGMPTGSDIANLCVFGYDPKKYYTGRSPIEALGLKIPLSDDDTVFRLNLVSISTEGDFEDKIMLDHSSDKITNEEAYELLDALSSAFGTDKRKMYRGVSYRHIMIWSGIDYNYTMMPPHDILGKCIRDYLPEGPYGAEVLDMMKKSYDLLMSHPVNLARMEKGLRPANCLWLWGEGTKPQLTSFTDEHNIRGTVVTAVPLITGLAYGIGLSAVEVEGATGDYYTNYKGKAEACISAFKNGDDFVFCHVEAPDECGHDGDTELKVKSIERIDEEILAPVKKFLDSLGEDYKILLLPDHPTPIEARTHVIAPVPYVIYNSDESVKSGLSYSEKDGEESGNFTPLAYTIMSRFIKEGK
ncbi:MAG: cofactor-independent phosphoglycerate mutase [Oscillospiraceae bacterium]|nr:cofactor-independent phosphoglycerate mutase [Oscillospiraceae bacterium]